MRIGPLFIGRVPRHPLDKRPKAGRPTRSESALRAKALLDRLNNQIKLEAKRAELEELRADLAEHRERRKKKEPRKNAIEQFFEYAGPLAAHLLAGQGITVQTPPARRLPAPTPVQGEIVTETPPRQIAAGEPVPAPATSTVPDIASMHPESAALVQILERQTPEQAARWLMERPEQPLKILVGRIVATPDTGIDRLLAQVSFVAPQYADAVTWLQSRRPWLLEMVGFVRVLAAQPVPRT